MLSASRRCRWLRLTAVERTGAGRRTASSIRSRSDGSRSTASMAEARMRMWTRSASVRWNGSAIATPVFSDSAAAGLPSISPISTRPVSGRAESSAARRRSAAASCFGGEADDEGVGGEQWSLLDGCVEGDARPSQVFPRTQGVVRGQPDQREGSETGRRERARAGLGEAQLRQGALPRPPPPRPHPPAAQARPRRGREGRGVPRAPARVPRRARSTRSRSSARRASPTPWSTGSRSSARWA